MTGRQTLFKTLKNIDELQLEEVTWTLNLNKKCKKFRNFKIYKNKTCKKFKAVPFARRYLKSQNLWYNVNNEERVTRAMIDGSIKCSAYTKVTKNTFINDSIKAWNKSPLEIKNAKNLYGAKAAIRKFVTILPVWAEKCRIILHIHCICTQI